MTTTDAPAIVKVARDLREVLRCYDELRDQAISDGDNPTIPGGQAMVALGPVANIEAWGHLYDTTWRLADHPDESRRRIYTSEPDEDSDEAWGAYQVIEYWAERWRRARDAEYDGLRTTMLNQTSYVRESLTWARDHEPEWARFTEDIRTARLRIENVVSAGRRAERSRVRCDRDACTKHPHLIKVHAPRYIECWSCSSCNTTTPARYACEDCNRTWSPRSGRCPGLVGPKKERRACDGRLVEIGEPAFCFNARCPSFARPSAVWTSDPADDWWKCPACKHNYRDPTEFQRAYTRMLWAEQAAKYVSLPDAVATLVAQGRGERTVRRWLAPPVREHTADGCTVCARTWPVAEYPACPGLPPGTPNADNEPAEPGAETCGGILEPVFTGDDPELVVEGYCEVATRRTWVYWPDLWRRHITTRRTNREKIGA